MSNRNDGSFSWRGYRARVNVRDQVHRALSSHPDIDASQIAVLQDSATGDVILTGTVTTPAELQLAQSCATSVPGVHVVHNRLVVAAREPDDGVVDV